MKIERSHIHLIELKNKSYYNLNELKEQMVLYIMQPNKAILELMLESYFLISSMFKGVEMNIFR